MTLFIKKLIQTLCLHQQTSCNAASDEWELLSSTCKARFSVCVCVCAYTLCIHLVNGSHAAEGENADLHANQHVFLP